MFEESQEMCFLLAEPGVFTTITLIQGSTDSAHALYAGIMGVFENFLYICVLFWIDDVLVYIRSFEDLLIWFEEVFHGARTTLRNGPAFQVDDLMWQKDFFRRRKVNPQMIDSLLSLPEPKNATVFQKFSCVAKWVSSTFLSMQQRNRFCNNSL